MKTRFTRLKKKLPPVSPDIRAKNRLAAKRIGEGISLSSIRYAESSLGHKRGSKEKKKKKKKYIYVYKKEIGIEQRRARTRL